MEQLKSSDPREVGPYRLIARIDAGGMGQVYLGLSAGGRRVAIKVMLPGYTADPEFRRRFKREVEAAKRVGGHYTALVVDADADADAPWMATQFIEGPSLETTVRQDGPLSTRQLRDLGAALAEGLTRIHGCGLIHRDLKPSNILMSGDGPRIIDFGLAQADGATRVTQAGTMVGTPAYMSPEQVDDGDVGPPSDVFSLGGILVYAATGQRPFRAPNVASVIYAVLTKAPDLHSLSGPLRDIIAACLAKDPAARPTPASLVAAFGNVPAALPPSLPRAPGPSGGQLDHTTATVTPTPSPRRRPAPRPPFPARGRQLERPRPITTDRPGPQVTPADDSWWQLAADPAGRWIAAADGDGTITVWDPASGLPTRSWPAQAPVRALAAGRDDWLASCGEHGTVRVWDARTGTACAAIGLGGDVTALALDWPGGLLVTGGADRMLRAWDVADPREPMLLTTLPCPARPTAIALDDGGGRVAAGCADGWLRVWDLTGAGPAEPVDTRQVQAGPVLAVAWDPAGDQWLSSGTHGIGPLRAAALSAAGYGALIDRGRGGIHVFPLDEPAHPRRMRGTSSTLAGTAFAGPGLLVMGGADGRLYLWDSRRCALRPVLAPDGAITSVAAAPGSAYVAVGDDARRITVFSVAHNGTLTRRWSHSCLRVAAAMAFSPDGSRLATADDAVRVWKASDGTEVSPLPGSAARARAVAFDRSGEHLAAAGMDGVVRVWRGSRLRHALTGHKGSVSAVAFGPDGQLVSAGSDDTVRTWDLATGDESGYAADLGYRARVLASHPADGSFAIGSADGTVRLCAPPLWSDPVVLEGHVQSVMSLSFDDAGDHLATAGLDGTARVWDLARGSARQVIVPGPDRWAAAVALADGDFHGHGPGGEFIWQALGLTRHPLPPLAQEDIHG